MKSEDIFYADENRYALDPLSEMENYYNWILKELEPYIGKRVLEVGAGIGTFTKVLLNLKSLEKIFLVEPSKELMGILKDSFADNSKTTGFICSAAEELEVAEIVDMNVDTAIFINVLEHILKDFEVLQKFSCAMKPGQKILTFSPAFKVLFSELDSNAGHYRRYSKKEIKKSLESAGFKVIYLRYFNFLGFFTWLVFVKLFKSNTFSKKGVKCYDALVPYLQQMETVFPPPLGQSVIAVGEVI